MNVYHQTLYGGDGGEAEVPVSKSQRRKSVVKVYKSILAFVNERFLLRKETLLISQFKGFKLMVAASKSDYSSYLVTERLFLHQNDFTLGGYI